MDNAANNTTMMEALSRKLQSHDIHFVAAERQVMCFAHVIDLSSRRVIRAVEDSEPSNPIGHGRVVVRTIRSSGIRRDSFDDVIKNGNTKNWFKTYDQVPPQIIKLKPLQLLRQVRTRWDSVYHMLNRLREMRLVLFTISL